MWVTLGYLVAMSLMGAAYMVAVKMMDSSGDQVEQAWLFFVLIAVVGVMILGYVGLLLMKERNGLLAEANRAAQAQNPRP